MSLRAQPGREIAKLLHPFADHNNTTANPTTTLGVVASVFTCRSVITSNKEYISFSDMTPHSHGKTKTRVNTRVNTMEYELMFTNMMLFVLRRLNLLSAWPMHFGNTPSEDASHFVSFAYSSLRLVVLALSLQIFSIYALIPTGFVLTVVPALGIVIYEVLTA